MKFDVGMSNHGLRFWDEEEAETPRQAAEKRAARYNRTITEEETTFKGSSIFTDNEGFIYYVNPL